MRFFKYFFILSLSLNILGFCAYFFLWDDLIRKAYAGEAPAWMDRLIDLFYPRFYTERHRFSSSFFTQKVFQILIRFSFFNAVLLLALSFRNILRSRMGSLFDSKTNYLNVRILSFFYFALVIYFSWDRAFYLSKMAYFVDFYQPVFILKVLHLPYLSPFWAWLLWAMMLVASLLGLLRYRPFLMSLIAGSIFIFLQAYLYSFHKINHNYALFNQVVFLMPFLLYGKQIKEKALAAWPLEFIRILLPLIYFLSGLEKVFVSGWDWFSASHFKAYLNLHPTPPGLWLMQHDHWCVLLAALTLLFELGFILVIPYKRLMPFFIIWGILFHLGVYVFMGIGGWLPLWVMAYVFLVDWDKFVVKIFPNLKAK